MGGGWRWGERVDGFEGDAVCLGLHLKANVTQWEEALWHYVPQTSSAMETRTRRPQESRKQTETFCPPVLAHFSLLLCTRFKMQMYISLRVVSVRRIGPQGAKRAAFDCGQTEVCVACRFLFFPLVSVAVVVVAT